MRKLSQDVQGHSRTEINTTRMEGAELRYYVKRAGKEDLLTVIVSY